MVSAIMGVLERFRMVTRVELAGVWHTLRQKIWNKKWFALVHLDLEASTGSVFGPREDAMRTNHTEGSDEPMLHLLFAFIAQTGECVNCSVRHGTVHSEDESLGFLKESLALLAKRVWKVIVRADSFYFSTEFFRELLQRGS